VLSVIVAVADETRGLRQTVESVLGQTLRGVELLVVASARPPGLPERAVYVPSKGAGLGTARDLGLGRASGEMVMFPACGETLDRHAGRTVIMAAADGADVVAGRQAVPSSCAATAYRTGFLRRHGIGFPSGSRHGETLFNALVTQADPAVVRVPHTIATRMVRPPLGDPEELLAVQRAVRHLPEFEVAFLHDRLPELAAVAVERPAVRARLREYLADLDTALLDRCDPITAIAAFMALKADADGLAEVTDHLATGLPPAGLVERDGRILWCDRHLDSALGRRLLDVTALGLHCPPPARKPPSAPRGRLARLLADRRVKGAVYRRLLVRLPIRARTVVFESHLGRQYSDSPKAIYERLVADGKEIRAIWSYDGDPTGFPDSVRLVKRMSWAYFHALATARFWVDNQGFPAEAVKRRGTTYIQTWHGSAYKHMGFDEPEVKLASAGAQARLRRMVGRFDCFLVRSEHDVRTLVRGLGVRAEPLRVGYPRNDALVTGGDPAALDRLRAGLGLEDGRRIVLYAPTFRKDANGTLSSGVPFDTDRFVRELGDRYILLVRAHYFDGKPVVGSPCGTVRDVSHVHDMTDLLLLADALVTDYSSVMFDFALLDRPMVFYVPDLDDYARRGRGAYFDLAAEAPGPVARDQDRLFAALHRLDDLRESGREARHAFVERYGEYDTGTAAKAVVERFWG
jgi:CDP-glycerol glycerophosphotransferase (TagB/SpsB family)